MKKGKILFFIFHWFILYFYFCRNKYKSFVYPLFGQCGIIIFIYFIWNILNINWNWIGISSLVGRKFNQLEAIKLKQEFDNLFPELKKKIHEICNKQRNQNSITTLIGTDIQIQSNEFNNDISIWNKLIRISSNQLVS